MALTRGGVMTYRFFRLCSLVSLCLIVTGCGDSTNINSGVDFSANSNHQTQSAGQITIHVNSGPPDTPTSLKAIVGRSWARLTWNASSGAKSYNVYRDGSFVASVTNPAYSDTGLTTDVEYFYAVSALNNAGESKKCTQVSVTTAVWTKLLGTTANEVGHAVALDTSGNIYITGETSGNLDGQTNTGRNDIFLAKYDSSGTKQWVRLVGTPLQDRAYGVAVDSSGNVFIAGCVQGSVDGQTYAGGNDIVIAKYDSSGTKQWARLLGTTGSDVASAIALDLSGNVYITGSTNGMLDGQTNAGSNDIFVAKYGSSGTKEWVRLLGSTMSDQGNGIAVDSSGNISVTGYAGGTIDGQAYAGNSDIVTAGYDSSGTKQWTRLFGTASTDKGNGIALDSSGNIFITGSTMGSPDGLANAGMSDIFIVKYDTSGTKQWVTVLGTTEHDQGYGIALDSSGNIFITGYTRGNLDGNTFAGGWGDIFVAKYDQLGSKQWVKLLGTTSEEWGYGVAVNSAGDAIFTGYTYGNLDGLSNSGYNSDPILGTSDAFLAKIGADGVMW